MTRVVVGRAWTGVDDVLDMRSRTLRPRPFRRRGRLVCQAPIITPQSPFLPGLVTTSFFLFGGKCVGKVVEMASNMPLPIPPRTPTPPSDDATSQYATQLDEVPVDRDALSPLKDTFPKSATFESGSQDRLSPTKASFNLDPRSADPTTAMQNGSSDTTPAGPFNFNTTVMAKGPVVKSVRSTKRCYSGKLY